MINSINLHFVDSIDTGFVAHFNFSLNNLIISIFFQLEWSTSDFPKERRRARKFDQNLSPPKSGNEPGILSFFRDASPRNLMVKSGNPHDSVGSQKPWGIDTAAQVEILGGLPSTAVLLYVVGWPQFRRNRRTRTIWWKTPEVDWWKTPMVGCPNFSSFFDFDSNKTGLSSFSNFAWLFPQFPQATQLVVSKSTKKCWLYPMSLKMCPPV